MTTTHDHIETVTITKYNVTISWFSFSAIYILYFEYEKAFHFD